jgi:TetR/AcrR family transcriptional regulator, ethionamide resistance regulator
VASPSRRTGAPTAKRAAVEAAILDAAHGLLHDGAAYADLGIERIATRAGISRTAFYFYFRDKRELLMRLTENVAEELYAQAERWWGGEGEGARELTEALEMMIAAYREHGALLRAVVESSTYDEVVATFWRGVVGRFVEATETRIEAEQAAGRARGVPARATAFALVWMTERSCYQHLVQGGDFADPELTRALADVWLRGVYGRLPSEG